MWGLKKNYEIMRVQDPQQPSLAPVHTAQGVWAVPAHSAGYLPEPHPPGIGEEVRAMEMCIDNLGITITIDEEEGVQVRTKVNGGEPEPLAVELVQALSTTPLPDFENREVATAWADIVVARF